MNEQTNYCNGCRYHNDVHDPLGDDFEHCFSDKNCASGERFKPDYELLESQLAKVIKQRDEAVRELEFYADKDIWQLSGTLKNKRYSYQIKQWGEGLDDMEEFSTGMNCPFEKNTKIIEVVAGKLARETLAKIGGGKS